MKTILKLSLVTLSTFILVSYSPAQVNQSNLFEAPNCIKSAILFLGETKTRIIENYGTDYRPLDSNESSAMLYSNNLMKGINPIAISFIFKYNNNSVGGVALYFDYMQFDDVLKFMNNNFEAKEPPPGSVVSFFKAWMQYGSGNNYIWKLTKTDRLFYLTLKSLKRE